MPNRTQLKLSQRADGAAREERGLRLLRAAAPAVFTGRAVGDAIAASVRLLLEHAEFEDLVQKRWT